MKRYSWVYPSVDDSVSAKRAARHGVVAALVTASFTTLFGVLAVRGVTAVTNLGIDAYTFVDASLFLGAAFGIWRGWRAAAVFGLALFILEKLFFWVSTGRPPGGFAAVLIIAFLNGVRGTYALHRLSKMPVSSDVATIEPR